MILEITNCSVGLVSMDGAGGTGRGVKHAHGVCVRKSKSVGSTYSILQHFECRVVLRSDFRFVVRAPQNMVKASDKLQLTHGARG